MLEYAVKIYEKQIVFISNNNADFGYKDQQGLHESLSNECEALGIKVHYFKDIKDFVISHSTKIDFITNEWISKNMNYQALSDELSYIISGRDVSRITSSFQRSTGNEVTGDVSIKDINTYAENNISIYEMSNNQLIVNLTINCEVSVELGYYRRSYNYEDYYRDRATESKWLDVEVYASITVVNKEIIDFEIDDWDFDDHWN